MPNLNPGQAAAIQQPPPPNLTGAVIFSAVGGNTATANVTIKYANGTTQNFVCQGGYGHNLGPQPPVIGIENFGPAVVSYAAH